MSKELKTKAIEMRKQGISIIKIAKELGVSKSSVSVWTRDITLTEKQKEQLLHREVSDKQALAHSNIFKIKRQQYQNKGREKIKEGDLLYIAGCMLYWGEGNKSINQCRLVNSELPMLIVFKNFLHKFFKVSDKEITININSYTDINSQEEIKKYWLQGLDLPEPSLKNCIWNQYPISSKKKNIKKSEYGTCTLTVCKTEIVQEILGAIQEFGNFENPKWLKRENNEV